jgi:hypothetical protein
MVPAGLTALLDSDLERLMKMLHRGTLPIPLTRQALLLRGLNRIAENGDVLFGLEASGVRATIVATVAERRKFTEKLDQISRAQARQR